MFFPNYKVSYIVGRKRYVGGQRKGGWWSKQAKLCQRFEVSLNMKEVDFFYLYLCSRQKGFCLLLTLLVVFDYSFSCKKSPMF